MGRKSGTQTESPSAVLARLREQAAKVAADDFGILAQMHGWCEQLAQGWRQEPPTGEPLADRACGLMHQLEQVILGEAQDEASALKHIAAELDELNRLVALGDALGTDAEAAQQDPPAPGPGDAPRSSKCPDDSSESAELRAEPPQASAQPDAEAEPKIATYESTPLYLNPAELEFVKGFVEEAGEHVESVEGALLEVERTPDDLSKINDLFRPFHTIKGAAGFLNLTDIGNLTHEAETLLDQARKGQRPVTPGIIDLVFDVIDILKAQIAGIAGHLKNPTGDPVPQPPVGEMIEKLRAVIAYRLEPPSRSPAEPSTARTGETLVQQADIAPELVDFALEVQKADPQQKTGQILVDMGVTTPRQVAQAIRSQTAGASSTPAAASPADQTVRIDTNKLDMLVDMVGELVIAQTLVTASEYVSRDVKLAKDVGQVAKILRNLQEITLSMRMIPIGSTFQKMARLVRDVSRKAGKNVELTLSGEDTELDKNVIQQISDPLVHMVRNAVDHGLESPRERLTADKPATGRVHLGAYHQGGNVIIEISDDGKGLDAKRLIAKGIEKGLVPPGTELSDSEAFALIFAPGFSTAETVTDISGRGVGMDVVKRNIDRLRGKVEITSEKGKGTTFRIRLPLTLAIIDGMTVRVAGQRFIIPTVSLQQALRPTPSQITTVQHRGEMIQVRGQFIPLVQLGPLFNLSEPIDPCQAMVVIANSDGTPVGLVVDELIGQQQVVIKSLGTQFESLRGVSGAAILGDGRVGLILEIAGLTALHANGMVSRN